MENFGAGFLAGIVVYCFYLIKKSFFKVEEGHVASLNDMGKARRNATGGVCLFQAGIHGKWPWEKVESISLMETGWNLGGNEHTLHVMAFDGTLLGVECSVRIRAQLEKAYHLIYQMKDSAEQIRNFLESALRDEIANFGPTLAPGEAYILLRVQKSDFLRQYQKSIEPALSQFGVELLGLDLIEVTPPSELATALNSVQTAKADSEAWVAKAQAVAEQNIYSAVESLEIAKAEAKAKSTEIEVIGQRLKELKSLGTLMDYLKRRTEEVMRRKSKLTVVRQGVES